MIGSRRSFSLAALSAASAARVWGANDRLNLALLGAGGRGSYVAKLASQQPGVAITVVNDVNPMQVDAARSDFAKAAESANDFRAVLDRKDVDAVIIGSPDHWHVPMLVAAVSAGKDVYVEKPLTKSVEEGRIAIDAVKKAGRVVQVGYQQRSTPHYSTARDLIRQGMLGNIAVAQTFWYQDYIRADWTTKMIPGDNVNWTGWLGTAPRREFDRLRMSRWRWFWDYGGGHLTDLFSHWVDSVHWVTDDAELKETHAFGHNAYFKQFECPDTITLTSRYAKGHLVTYDGSIVGGADGGGIIIRGSTAVMHLYRGSLRVVANEDKPGEPLFSARARRDGTIDHVENWLACIKSRNQPNSDVVSAVAAANAAHYGNLSYRQGKRITLPSKQTPASGGDPAVHRLH